MYTDPQTDVTPVILSRDFLAQLYRVHSTAHVATATDRTNETRLLHNFSHFTTLLANGVRKA